MTVSCFYSFSGISYDKPLPPIQVASQRAERIAKEKKVIYIYETCSAELLLPFSGSKSKNSVVKTVLM